MNNQTVKKVRPRKSEIEKQPFFKTFKKNWFSGEIKDMDMPSYIRGYRNAGFDNSDELKSDLMFLEQLARVRISK